MSLIGYALRTAKQYYNPDTYKHALRVASFVADNIFISDSKMDNCIILAIMHDLEEDTNWDRNKCSELDKYLKESIGLITQGKDISYIEYIKNIKENMVLYPEVYWVKIADMKDHLTQTETLTDKLKEKYIEALPYLL